MRQDGFFMYMLPFFGAIFLLIAIMFGSLELRQRNKIEKFINGKTFLFLNSETNQLTEISLADGFVVQKVGGVRCFVSKDKYCFTIEECFESTDENIQK